MQINRLFEIVYILLYKKRATARELAERFEVSTRTIYRDIEVLSGAGIPIFMSKGKNGGISLIDKFVLNKSILSEQEETEILSALQSLNVANFFDVNNTLSKLSIFFNRDIQNWIEVDFSPWNDNKNIFYIIKSAILQKKVISFDYFSASGEKTMRNVEPLQLWFKNKDWYLRAFCIQRQDLRLFKLRRIKNLKMTDKNFERALVQDYNYDEQKLIYKSNIKLKLKVDLTQEFRVYDEFDEESVTKNDDGSFSIITNLEDEQWLYSYILSFGVYVEVLEPIYIRENIKTILKEIMTNYL